MAETSVVALEQAGQPAQSFGCHQAAAGATPFARRLPAAIGQASMVLGEREGRPAVAVRPVVRQRLVAPSAV